MTAAATDPANGGPADAPAAEAADAATDPTSSAPTDDVPSAAHDAEARPGVAFWVGVVVGGAIVVWSARGAVAVLGGGLASLSPGTALDSVDAFLFGDRLRSFLIWFAGAALLADLVVLPASGAAASLVRRVVPTWAWPVVRAALLTTAVLTLLASPMLLGIVDPPINPTVRPRNTTTGWLAALAVVWIVTLVVLAVVRLRARRAPAAAHDV